MQEYITISRSQEAEVKQFLPSDSIANGMARFFSVFADYTRVRILSALSIKEMCVGDLAYILSINQSTLSHQLKILRDAKMVDYRRSGKIIIYFVINPYINDAMLAGVNNYDMEQRRTG